ncbi:MAG: hypothetical protein PHT59_06845 [Candidatus Omnitrophica bacterium]|nr:hypothetical protein [Candidatus Omnitrophota bacterium]
MKRWAWVVVLLYAAVIILFTIPVLVAAFYDPQLQTDFSLKGLSDAACSTASAWGYWAGLLVLLAAQFVLLLVPVKVAGARPVSRRFVFFPIIAGAMLFGLLVTGLALCTYETVTKSGVPTVLFTWLIAGIFVASWAVWSVIFWRWSKRSQPRTFIERQCRVLFAGSILQLLVAVPAHLIARLRNYCCAGFSTFMGLTFGIAVMLMSFGPAVYFLFVERWKRLHPEKNGNPS